MPRLKKGDINMFPGESVFSMKEKVCPDCQTPLNLKVCSSAAGYYVGTTCDCGPFSRETRYFCSKEEAEEALRTYEKTGVLPNQRMFNQAIQVFGIFDQ